MSIAFRPNNLYSSVVQDDYVCGSRNNSKSGQLLNIPIFRPFRPVQQLTFGLWELAKKRQIQERLRAEIMKTLGKIRDRGDDDFTVDDFDSMPYLVAVVKVGRNQPTRQRELIDNLTIHIGNLESPPGNNRHSTCCHERQHPAPLETHCGCFWKGLHGVTRSCRNVHVRLHLRIQLVR